MIIFLKICFYVLMSIGTSALISYTNVVFRKEIDIGATVLAIIFWPIGLPCILVYFASAYLDKKIKEKIRK